MPTSENIHVVLTPNSIWQQETRQRASATAAVLSWLSGAHRAGTSDGCSDTTSRKEGEGGKEPKRTAESTSSQSTKAKQLKTKRRSELREQGMQGGVQGAAEIQVDGSKRKGRVGQEGEQAERSPGCMRWRCGPCTATVSPSQPGPGTHRGHTPARARRVPEGTPRRGLLPKPWCSDVPYTSQQRRQTGRSAISFLR